MRKIIGITLVSVAGLLLAGCTTTQTATTAPAPVAAEQLVYLSADQIRQTIVGNTIEGVAQVRSVGNVQYKMHFENGTRIYRDRNTVRNNVSTGFGSYRIVEIGLICRTSKSRNKGMENCFRFNREGGNYFISSSMGNEQPTAIKILSGNAL